MIPKDIVIGQEYSHKSYPGVTYLGCDGDDDGINKNDKYLSINELPDPPKDNYTSVGNKVCSLSKAGAKFWDGFCLKKKLTPEKKSV